MTIAVNTTSLTQSAQAAALAAVNASSSGTTATAASASGTSTSASGTSTGATSTGGGSNALAQLGANFNQFLQLLLTQVQNQDPTAPTDTTQFTTELVQFTGVQEQVNANTSLGQLIGLQQSGQVLQSAGLVGQQATVTSNELSLQNSKGEVQFSGTAGEPIGISIVDANGNAVRNVTLTASGGTNTWTWNGLSDSGTQMPDGAYGVAVQTQATDGSASAVPFSVVGTTTGVSTSGTTTMLDMGALSVGLSNLESIGAN